LAGQIDERLGAAAEHTGAWLLITGTTNEPLAVLPWVSLAEHDTVVVLNANVEPDAGVQIDLRRSPRRLTVEAGSGGVTVGLPDDIGAEVDISTGSGGIQTDFPLQTNRYERNQLRGRIGNGSARISIAMNPPQRKKKKVVTMYWMPMTLWSVLTLK